MAAVTKREGCLICLLRNKKGQTIESGKKTGYN